MSGPGQLAAPLSQETVDDLRKLQQLEQAESSGFMLRFMRRLRRDVSLLRDCDGWYMRRPSPPPVLSEEEVLMKEMKEVWNDFCREAAGAKEDLRMAEEDMLHSKEMLRKLEAAMSPVVVKVSGLSGPVCDVACYDGSCVQEVIDGIQKAKPAKTSESMTLLYEHLRLKKQDLIKWLPSPTTSTTNEREPRTLKLTLVKTFAEPDEELHLESLADNPHLLGHFPQWLFLDLLAYDQPRQLPLQERLERAKAELEQSKSSIRDALLKGERARAKCCERLCRVLLINRLGRLELQLSAELFLEEKFAEVLEDFHVDADKLLLELWRCLRDTLAPGQQLAYKPQHLQAGYFTWFKAELDHLFYMDEKGAMRSTHRANRIRGQDIRCCWSRALDNECRSPTSQRRHLRGPRARESYLRSLGTRKRNVVRAAGRNC